MSEHISAFKGFIIIYFLETGHHNIHWYYQWWPLRQFPLHFFLSRNCSCGMKISINFVNVCSKPTLCILFKLNTHFFSCCSCPFWLIWYNLHLSLLVNPSGNTSKIQEWKIKKMYGIFSKLTTEMPEQCQCFLMSSCQWDCSGVFFFLLTLNRLHTMF